MLMRIYVSDGYTGRPKKGRLAIEVGADVGLVRTDGRSKTLAPEATGKREVDQGMPGIHKARMDRQFGAPWRPVPAPIFPGPPGRDNAGPRDRDHHLAAR